MARIDHINHRLRAVNAAIKREHQQGAVQPGYYSRLMVERYQLEDEKAQGNGIRTLHLVCGHTRLINVGTWEELDMERTGTVQCRSTKPSLAWPRHRMEHMGVMGWKHDPEAYGMIDFDQDDVRCPYDPINGTHCETVGTIAVKRGDRRILVCDEHLPRYVNNGWTRVVEAA